MSWIGRRFGAARPRHAHQVLAASHDGVRFAVRQRGAHLRHVPLVDRLEPGDLRRAALDLDVTARTAQLRRPEARIRKVFSTISPCCSGVKSQKDLLASAR